MPYRADVDPQGPCVVPVGRRPRVAGVDVTRGLALVGMIATHVFATFDDGRPTFVHVVASGRSATTFVLIAGVSLAFLSGGQRGVRGREWGAASAGLAVRALLIGAIGLALGHLGEANSIYGILPFYAVLFLLAIPLLGCPPRVLLGVAAAMTALGPVLLLGTGASVPSPSAGPAFTTLSEPGELLSLLFLTGKYPVVIYLAYLCTGLAIGRLDLLSRRTALLLLVAGAATAVGARVLSLILLYPLGGMSRLIEQEEGDTDPEDTVELLWSPDRFTSWWHLALPAPHGHTPIDMLHALGSAVAVLGAVLLLTRIPAVARVLSPLAAAGALSLTIYSTHLVLLATDIQDGPPLLVYVSLVAGALALAWVWRLAFRQGPLEALVSWPATAVRSRYLPEKEARTGEQR